MTRALPWLTKGVVKTGKATTAKSALKPDADSDEDVVNSDLDAVHVYKKQPQKKMKKPAKKRVRASSSSPPPPGPPPVESMKPGFAADDIWMMVEDEFYSTAQLYTGHIHHAEYARLRKLHKSRGQETLAGLGRGTDGKTEQSKALRVKMESVELAKKQRESLRKMKADIGYASDGEGSDAEDEYRLVPQLAGLMRQSQMALSQDLAGLVKPRVDTRAAAGYSQSPYKAARTRDVFAEEKRAQQQRKAMPKVDEHDDDSNHRETSTSSRMSFKASDIPIQAADDDTETDDDDLDAGVPSEESVSDPSLPARALAPASNTRTLSKTDARRPSDSRPFSRFARPEKSPSTQFTPELSNERSPKREMRGQEVRVVSDTSTKRDTSPSPRNSRPTIPPTPPHETRLAELARKRAERIAAEAKRQPIKKEEVDDIPTFLF